MSNPPTKPRPSESDYEQQLREMNDALLMSSVRQHELADQAQKAEAALAESEEQLRRAIEESPIPVIMHAEDGEVLRISRSWTDLTGYTIEDKSALQTWLTRAYGDGGDDVRTAVKWLFESGQAMRDVEFDVVTHGGNPRIWSFSASSPGALRDGRRFVIGMAEDITNRKHAEQALKELDQRKDEFLANMSHEIRTPLTSIMGYADILLSKLKDPEDIECINIIKESGDYLIEIVNDILDLSKIEAGKIVLNIEAVNVHSVLAEAQGLMDVRARQKNLALSLRYEGTLPESIQTDRTRLRQILINLLSNAIKFTDQGRVEIVARCVDGFLQIEVIDTGIGIAPEDQEILFQPFTQADSTNTRQYGGTGLGLTITKRLAEMLGGSISFESTLGKGSTFRLAIPAGTPGSAKPTDLRPETTGAPFYDISLNNRHVLVVDDKEDIRYVLSRYIRDAGGRPEAVADGETATEAVKAASESDPFDAVILDIHMPGMNGYQVARKLRADGFREAIIAVTAGAMVGDREKCLQAGCNDYLTKPIDRQALVRFIALHSQKTGRAYERV